MNEAEVWEKLGKAIIEGWLTSPLWLKIFTGFCVLFMFCSLIFIGYVIVQLLKEERKKL